MASQQEVLEYLGQHKGQWYTRKQLSLLFEENTLTKSHNMAQRLNKLVDWNMVEKKIIFMENHYVPVYRFKSVKAVKPRERRFKERTYRDSCIWERIPKADSIDSK